MRVKVEGIHFFGFYHSPNTDFEAYAESVDKLASSARGFAPVLVGGDFNAWATEWGSPEINMRGQGFLVA